MWVGSIGEAAQRLCVSVRTVERLVATGRLPQVRVERLARFRVSDLEAYVNSLAETTGLMSMPGTRVGGTRTLTALGSDGRGCPKSRAPRDL